MKARKVMKNEWRKVEVPITYHKVTSPVLATQKQSLLSAATWPTGTEDGRPGDKTKTPIGQPPHPKQHARDAEVLPLTVAEEVEVIRQALGENSNDTQVHSLGWKETEGRYTRVRSVMDSGAAETVAPPTMAPTVRIRPSAGSMRGQHYVSASKQRLPNLGQQTISAVTSEYNRAAMTFQIADVSRPLTSVGEVCDRGNFVLFGPKGGYILPLEGGSRTCFERTGGIYELGLWLDDCADLSSDFPRQGR